MIPPTSPAIVCDTILYMLTCIYVANCCADDTCGFGPLLCRFSDVEVPFYSITVCYKEGGLKLI